MTCEEAMAGAATDGNKLSRGERAAIMKHIVSCTECMDRTLKSLVRLLESGGISEESRQFARQDIEDPEFRETMYSCEQKPK